MILTPPITALVIAPTGGAIFAVELTGTDLDRYIAVRGLIGGGWLEAIGGRYLGAGWAMFLAEDRAEQRCPANENATRLAAHLGWRHHPGDVVLGTGVLVGKNGCDEVTVPSVVVRAARELEMPVLTIDHRHYDEEAVTR